MQYGAISGSARRPAADAMLTIYVLPALGYGEKQMQELEQTINNSDTDIIVSGTPIDITRVLKTDKTIVRVRYGVGEETAKELEKIVDGFISKNLS